MTGPSGQKPYPRIAPGPARVTRFVVETLGFLGGVDNGGNRLDGGGDVVGGSGDAAGLRLLMAELQQWHDEWWPQRATVAQHGRDLSRSSGMASRTLQIQKRAAALQANDVVGGGGVGLNDRCCDGDDGDLERRRCQGGTAAQLEAVGRTATTAPGAAAGSIDFQISPLARSPPSDLGLWTSSDLPLLSVGQRRDYIVVDGGGR